MFAWRLGKGIACSHHEPKWIASWDHYDAPFKTIYCRQGFFEATGIRAPPKELYVEIALVGREYVVVKIWGDTDIGLPDGWMWKDE